MVFTRYKLRTLLVVTAFFGAVAGYYGNRISALSEERKGLEELGLDWSVSVNRLVEEKESSKSRRTFQSLVDWPLKKILGAPPKTDVRYKGTRRTRSLELFSSLDEPGKSLKGLNRFKQLEQLKFYRNPATSRRITIDADQVRHIANVDSLKKLWIGQCSIYSDGLAQLSRLNLTHLTCGASGWGNIEIEQIARIQSLENLSIWSLAPASLQPLKRLPKLSTISIYSNEHTDFESIAGIQNLKELQVRGRVVAEQLELLENATQLEYLKFDYCQLGEFSVDRILKLAPLKRVDFGWHKITKADFQNLKAAGIKVNHKGLIDYKPNTNLFRYECLYSEVDLNRSELVGVIEPGRPGVDWSIRVSSLAKYCPTICAPPRFESPSFNSKTGWRELVGTKLFNVGRGSDEVNYLHDREHPTYDNCVEIDSRTGNQFHVTWRFSSELEEGYGKIDAHLFLRRVLLKSSQPISAEQAVKRFSQHLNVDDFDPPDTPDGTTSKTHVFRLKPTKKNAK